MRLIKNTGNDRVIDELRSCLAPGAHMDLASPAFSLYSFAEVQEVLGKLGNCRLVLPSAEQDTLALLGHDSDRSSRNQPKNRYLARQCSIWVHENCEVRKALSFLSQSTIIASHSDASLQRVITGSSRSPQMAWA